MHRYLLVFTALLFPLTALAYTGDMALSASNVSFGSAIILEGKTVRIYATVTNPGSLDLRGVVRFFDAKEQIQSDQPVSVLAGREDSVFVDWNAAPGEHTVAVNLIPFEQENDNPANNTVEKTVTVLADTDRDGIPNRDDPDDDNDSVEDTKDAFPLNRTETVDSDGDTIGNNKDDDDDNDGVKDTDDAIPLNANETIDTDRDGIGNNEDTDDDGDGLSDADERKKGTDPLKSDTDGDGVNDREDAYPLDPKQARDYDRDGISDKKDKDADNDGIPKTSDTNDTNLGPNIVITAGDSKSIRLIYYPDEPIIFETITSEDPDGTIVKHEWTAGEAKSIGPKFETVFPETGRKIVAVKLTDDKGESREKTFSIYVVPKAFPWILTAIAFLIIILAIFLLFKYSSRRPKTTYENRHPSKILRKR